ncbi:hypothetical protein IQ270_28720 [Microcoleus sp. LEGE 07076]|nr:hypothetical protein [Microcoleus sp. LEGE 07076]
MGCFDIIKSNGIFEGIHNKINLLKKCEFELRSFINIEIRALF